MKAQAEILIPASSDSVMT